MDRRGGEPSARRSGRAGDADLPVSSSPARDITGIPRGTRRSFPASTALPAESFTRKPGPRIWTTPASSVVIIGSGATAVTLLPAMAKTAGHVTMLQRSPTYVVSLPEEDAIANWLRRVTACHVGLPAEPW